MDNPPFKSQICGAGSTPSFYIHATMNSRFVTERPENQLMTDRRWPYMVSFVIIVGLARRSGDWRAYRAKQRWYPEFRRWTSPLEDLGRPQFGIHCSLARPHTIKMHFNTSTFLACTLLQSRLWIWRHEQSFLEFTETISGLRRISHGNGQYYQESMRKRSFTAESFDLGNNRCSVECLVGVLRPPIT